MNARMEPWKTPAKWLMAGGLVALSVSMAVGGYSLTDLIAAANNPGVTGQVDRQVQTPISALVELWLVGVILFLLALLAYVLARERNTKHGEEARSLEAKIVQDLFHGFMRMENRVEALEAALLHRAGRIMTGPRSN